MSFINKLAQALNKTRLLFSGVIKAETIEQIEETLIKADVGIKSTSYIIDQFKKHQVPNLSYKQILESILIKIFSFSSTTNTKVESHLLSNFTKTTPQIIIILGTPGSGKTTTIAKISYLFAKQGKKVLIAASDTYRAAASAQLEIWAEKINVDFIYSQKGQDAAAVAYDAIHKAITNNFDLVLIDTAGRLHTRQDLMEEAKKIKRVCQKFRSNAPDELYLVLDATVGQNGIQQAKIFNEQLNLTGIIVTKLDGTAKGGVVIPIALELKLPIRYIGIGENVDDIEEFNAHKYISALLQ